MNKCEGRLSKQECWDALQSFGNNKSPGNDGLSKEFYICFLTRSMPILWIHLIIPFRKVNCPPHKDKP